MSRFSLAARIMWRLDKEGGVVSDMQLTTLEDLEDHISDLPEDDLKDLKVDIHNFLDFWPRTSKQHTVERISHIFGVVHKLATFVICNFKMAVFQMKNVLFFEKMAWLTSHFHLSTTTDQLQWLHGE